MVEEFPGLLCILLSHSVSINAQVAHFYLEETYWVFFLIIDGRSLDSLSQHAIETMFDIIVP